MSTVIPINDCRMPSTDEAAARHRDEVAAGRRFAFGRNWQSFLATIDESRLRDAEQSIRTLLDVDHLAGRSFVDVGSGSGLFSLAAARLGASRVVSFDYDPDCVRCTAVLKQRCLPDHPAWTVQTGDALDQRYLDSLGQFDVVYSWGVLHQTGDMWRALYNVAALVSPGGRLAISLYNHQPLLTPFWRTVKRLYNRSPRLLGTPLVAAYFAAKCMRQVVTRGWRKNRRGMSLYHDAVDWIGGYPFETAAPDDVFRYFRDRGFQLTQLVTVRGGSGCNQFVFQRQG